MSSTVKHYVTFGQCHVHHMNGVTLDKDCVGVIKAPTQEQARELAMTWFKGKFGTSYCSIEHLDLQYYPRGLVEIN